MRAAAGLFHADLNWVEDGLQHRQDVAEEEVPGLSQRVQELLTYRSTPANPKEPIRREQTKATSHGAVALHSTANPNYMVRVS